MADGNLMDRAISNLVDNALKHTPQGGAIEVRVEEEPHKVIVSVQDSGEGIPPEIQSKVFEPFFTTKEVGKGTGLGLSIVYEIVKNHGGDLELSSRPGQGATFTVRLPLG